MRRCELLPRSFHPYLLTGGIVSVALSLGSPPAAVSGCRILRCPDFPLALRASDYPIDCLFNYIKFNSGQDERI